MLTSARPGPACFRQLVLSADQVARLPTWQPQHGWPVDWILVPSLPLARIEADVVELAERWEMSFDQRLDLGSGLGDGPAVVLELESGLRIGLALPGARRGVIPDVVHVSVEPTSIPHRFIEGIWPEAVVERFRDPLVDDVLAALDLPSESVVWRQPPLHDPPTSTPAGVARLMELTAGIRAPSCERGAAVRLLPAQAELTYLRGMRGIVMWRWIRPRVPPGARADAEPSLDWMYTVVVQGPDRMWEFWGDELQSVSA